MFQWAFQQFFAGMIRNDAFLLSNFCLIFWVTNIYIYINLLLLLLLIIIIYIHMRVYICVCVHLSAFSCTISYQHRTDPPESIIPPAPCPFCFGSAAGQAMLRYRGWFDVSAWIVSPSVQSSDVQVVWHVILNRTWHDEPKWPIFRNELKPPISVGPLYDMTCRPMS